MMSLTVKLLALLCLVAAPGLVRTAPAAQNDPNNLLNVETPNFFNYNSPLREPGSLQSRPYFDFLSTLYRRDATKTDLFRPYSRTTRDLSTKSSDVRPKRAIVFRPLFVYKQQQVKKQQINGQKAQPTH